MEPIIGQEYATREGDRVRVLERGWMTQDCHPYGFVKHHNAQGYLCKIWYNVNNPHVKNQIDWHDVVLNDVMLVSTWEEYVKAHGPQRQKSLLELLDEKNWDAAIQLLEALWKKDNGDLHPDIQEFIAPLNTPVLTLARSWFQAIHQVPVEHLLRMIRHESWLKAYIGVNIVC